jgi:hypothetical protein
MTRREIAVALLVPAAVPAQTEDLLKQARETVVRNSEMLAKHKIEIALEPAFQFKA